MRNFYTIAVVFALLFSGSANGQTKPYCTATHTYPCYNGEYLIAGITFHTLNNINSSCPTTNTTAYTNFSPTQYSTTLVEGNTYTISITSGRFPTYFGVWFDFNRDIDFEDTLEFIDLGLAQPFSKVEKSITIPKGSSGSVRMRIISDYDRLTKASSCGTIYYGETEDYTISAIDPMTFLKVEAIQKNLQPVAPGMVNQEILGVRVITKGSQNPLSINILNFTTLGTTVRTDVNSIASLYYTGPSNLFSALTRLDTSRIDLNGNLSFTGQFILTKDTNYFWLAYDVSPKATPGNFLDATCSNITIGKSNYVASTGAPRGNRKIIPGINMTSTTATSCEAYLFDAGGPSARYPTTRSIFTLYPAEKGKAVKIKIKKWDICADGCGTLRVFNGKDITQPLLTTLNSPFVLDSIVSSASDGSLTFDFDGLGYGTGWEFVASCAYNCFQSSLNVAAEIIQPACVADSGEVTAIVSGGMPPYKYQWATPSVGNLKAQASSIKVMPGSYLLKATDQNGCYDTSSFKILAPPTTSLTVWDTTRNVTCFNGNDGSISLGYGGTNSIPTFNWSNGATGRKLTNLSAGIYSVIVKDNFGCKRHRVTVNNGTVLNGGKIFTSDTLICYNFDPYYINSIQPPSGGQGITIYQWEKTTSQGCMGGWEAIPNSNSELYDPTALTQSTCFRRSYRNDCSVKAYSDTVVIQVSPELNRKAAPLIGSTKLCFDPPNSIFRLPYVPGYFYQLSIVPDDAGALMENDSTNILEIDWNYFYSGDVKVSYSIYDQCQNSSFSDSLLINIGAEAFKPVRPFGSEVMCQNPSDKVYRTTFYPTNNFDGNQRQESEQARPGVESYIWKITPATAGTISAKDTVATVNWNETFIGKAQIFIDATYACGAGPTPDTLDVYVTEVLGGNVGDNETIGLNSNPIPFVSYSPAQGPALPNNSLSFTYSWENAQDSAGAWIRIPNSSSLTFDVDSASIKRSTYYRRVAKAFCIADSVITYSNLVKLTIPSAVIAEGPSASADDYRIIISINGGFAPWQVTLTNGQQDTTYLLNFPLETVSLNFQGSIVIKKFTDGQGREGASEGIVQLSDALTFYRGFSPNGDNENETFVVRNILRYPNNTLFIYNREGAKLYEKANYDNSWNGDGLPDGTYFYFLSYTELGKAKKSTGYVEIRR